MGYIVRKGELWEIGQHLLYCGDSTKTDDFNTLMGNELADMVFTDPPYNVGYTGGRQIDNVKRDKLLNDNLSESNYEKFLVDLIKNLQLFSKPGAACYTCMTTTKLDILIRLFKENDYHMSTLIIWAKNHFTLGWSDYQRQYEPIYYGWKKGAPRLHPLKARNQSDLWQIKKPQKSPLHSTMKPIELVEKAIKNSSSEGDIILDPCGGSGTTLIACENLNRKCRMIEIEQKYCTTIINRYAEQFGDKNMKCLSVR